MPVEDTYDVVESEMDDARSDLGLKWSGVARRAGISVETLYRFRKGKRTDDTARAIERALGRGRGWIDAVAQGLPPSPQELAPQTSDPAAELAELRKEALHLLARADAIEAAMRRRGA